MIGFTYPQLLQAMQDWPQNLGANYVGNIPRCVEMGELRLVRDLDLEIFDVTDTLYLPAGTNQLTKPPELLNLRTMRYGNVLSFVGGDPNFALDAILLHMDGTGGSTTFSDSSANNYAFTASTPGGPSLSTIQYRFGQTSGLFPGGAEYLEGPAIVATGPLDLSVGDFTVECWIWPNALASQYVFGLGLAGTNGVAIEILSSGQVQGTIYTGAGLQTITSGASSLYTAGAWNHVALVSYGGIFSIYVNGVFTGTAGNSSSAVTPTGNVWIGNVSATGAGFAGYIDELRLTNNLARYTGNFTPPQAPFPGSTSPITTTGLTSPTYKRNYDYLKNFGNNPANTGPPRYYAEQDSNTWLLSAYSDQAYGVVVRYVMRPLSIVVLGSSWLGDRCGDLLLLTSLMEAEQFLKADDRFGDLSGDYQAKLQIARAELRNSVRGGDYSPIKPAAAPA
jgi:hypothetical protein